MQVLLRKIFVIFGDFSHLTFENTTQEIANNRSIAVKKNTIEFVKLIEWAEDIGIEHFIYISSAHVYGNLNRKINQHSNINPKSLYSCLHVFAENYIKSKFIKSTIIRPCSVFGDVS